MPWLVQHLHASISTLPLINFDHAPVLIQLSDPSALQQPARRHFKFETKWLLHPDCGQLISNSWATNVTGSSSFKVTTKLRNLSFQLKSWAKTHFSNISRRIQELEKKLLSLQHQITDEDLREEELSTRRQLTHLLKCDQEHWAQRAKLNWIKNGDRNNKFFHAMVKHRRSKNRIHALLDNNGNWHQDLPSLLTLTKDFFSNLLTPHDTTNSDLASSLAFIREAHLPSLTPRDSNKLCDPLTKFEIETAVFQMEGNKAPGPDGYPPSFFQHHWPTIRDDIFNMVASFFNRGFLLKDLNMTHMVLIPKHEQACSLKDFRPISLCNVSYRIISKVLANRLQHLMPTLISPFQNAFLKGRSISDNIIMTGELLHHMKKQKKSKNYWAAMKVDFFKAFDKVSWSFLLQVLKDMNFPAKWIQLIHQCISTVNVQVMVNGLTTESITPQCGLRQGDPLSPYLFLFCLNVLSHHLSNLQESKAVPGIKIARNSPRVNHIFFADDNIVFFKANLNSCQAIQQLLTSFAHHSGLAKNDSKSQVCLSPNTPRKFVKLMSKTLKCNSADTIGIYLGNCLDGKDYKQTGFQRLLDMISDRLDGWKGKLLSKAGRITLIKSTLASLSSYYLSHLSLTKLQAAKCDRLINNFLWGDTTAKRKMHLIGWHTVCLPLEYGGLGIRNTLDLNHSLLAKQDWKILHDQASLFSCFMRSKYGHPNHHEDFKCPNNASPIWKGIYKAFLSIKPDLRWQVGNGEKINIVSDIWYKPVTHIAEVHKVKDLISNDGIWDK